MALGLVAGQGVAAPLVAASSHTAAFVALGLVVGDLILLGVVILAAARGAERLGAATFGIRRPSWGPAIGWGAALLIGAFAFDGLLVALFGSHTHHHAKTHHLSSVTAILVVLGVAVTAPLAEETAFRGYLFPALTRWRGPWLAAAITAALFGAAHFAALPAVLLPGAAFFGFEMCLLFWFTGSLLPGVLVHSLNNALVLTAVTGGQLAPAILAAPLLCLLLLIPLSRERAPTAGADRVT